MARLRYYRADNFRRRDLQRAMRPMGATESEIERVLRKYRGRRWDKTAVGRDINLPFARWELLGMQAKRGKYHLGLRHIWPADRTAEQMRQYLKDRRRDADREKKKEDRMNRRINPKVKQISPRARVLAAMLTDEWTGSRQVIDRVKQHWLNSAGKQLKDKAVQYALHSAARELCEIGIAEQKIDFHHGHGIRFLRWNPTSTFRREDFQNFVERTRFPIRLGLAGEKNLSAQRRYAAKPGISDPGLSDKKRVRSNPYLLLSGRTFRASGTAQRGRAMEEVPTRPCLTRRSETRTAAKQDGRVPL